MHARDRVVRVGGPLQRKLLLALLVNSSELVLTDALISELWPHSPPARAENALQAHISRLRRRLMIFELDEEPPELVTHPSGYQLVVRDTDLDAAVFTARLEQVRQREWPEPERAVEVLREILAMWHGPVLGGAGELGAICAAAASRYEESRLAALELLYDYELASGHHTRIIPELKQVLRQHLFQERFWQQMMIALYRSGRQADALSVYRELWHRLAEEMGLEPSPTMRGYERAILDRDPQLDVSVARRGSR
jgi:DNA-binding SARP family transcriptional activator